VCVCACVCLLVCEREFMYVCIRGEVVCSSARVCVNVYDICELVLVQVSYSAIRCILFNTIQCNIIRIHEH
jgi:hypothetical protein